MGLLPVDKYSPVGAVLLTCSPQTQYALVTTLASQATLKF